MSDDNKITTWSDRLIEMANRDPLAARVLAIFLAADDAQDPDTRIAAACGALQVTKDEFVRACERLEAEGFASIRWVN